MTPLTWITASPDGSRLGIGTEDGRFLLWRIADRTLVREFDAGAFVVRACWSADGARLLVATMTGRVLVWDGDGQQQDGVLDTGHGTLRDLALRPDGRAWATCGSDGVVRIWDAATRALQQELRDGQVAATAVGFAKGSVVAGYDDGCFVAWSADGKDKLAGGPVVRFPPVYSLAVDATGERVVFGGGRGGLQEVLVGTAGAWRAGARWSDPPKPIAVNALQFAADGRFVAACSDDCARRYDSTRDVLGTTLGTPFWLRSPKPAWRQDFIVAGACFVPGTDLVATCHWTGAARLWRGASCVATFTPAAPPTSAAPSTPPPAPEPAPVPPAAATPPPMVTPAAPPMAAPVPTPPPAPPAGGAWVHTETATLQLTVGSEVALPGPATPTLAFAPLRCSACGTDTVLAAPVRYVTHDDDHFGYLDLWYASVHRGACRQCRAALAVELSFTRRTLLTRQTLTFQLDTVRNATGGALAAPAAHTIPEPPLLPARSRAECQLYMTLRPCACGHAEPLRRYALLDSDAGPCAQYQDPCPRCGQARGFRFLLPRTDPPAGSLGGPEPSPLLCPGELALHADTLLRRVPPDTAALTAEQRATAAQEVRQAVQALEEVVRFLLPTATALAGECFTSAAGQALFQKDPGRFTRARLESRLAACRTLLAALRGR